MNVSFTIPGAPQGKERPRFNRNTGRTYTPAKTRDYEKLVEWAYKCEAHGVRFTGPISANIVAVYPVPHSWSKRQQAKATSGQQLPLVKPDLDNVAKAVLDALNGLAYRDDAQVTFLSICKRYGERPCVVVSLMGEETADDPM